MEFQAEDCLTKGMQLHSTQGNAAVMTLLRYETGTAGIILGLTLHDQPLTLPSWALSRWNLKLKGFCRWKF
jgi:hypothetical protein